MNTIFITLTRKQQTQLKPLMAKIDEMFETGKKGMCLAQVGNGLMEVGVLSHRYAKKLCRLTAGVELFSTNREAKK